MFKSLTRGAVAGLLAAAVLGSSVADLSGQNTKIPSTLRYGSGYLDVPVASVLPHMAITGTYSGFMLPRGQVPIVNSTTGLQSGSVDFDDSWKSDFSLAIGLFDRVELGATIQQVGDAGNGGNMVGGFGRVALIRPEETGFGLAVGGRYVTAPSFDDIDANADYRPNRLGYPDALFRDGYTSSDDIDTEFTPYAVASAFVRGFDSDWFPQHDLTLSLGYGQGMFTDGNQLDWYSLADSKGWFLGSALHLPVGDGKLLNIMGEWNGFDINAGAQLDFSGIRVGAHVLGLNYARDEDSPYRSVKYGLLGSVALCPGAEMGGFLCEPRLAEREAPDTVYMPPPPPDTVVVEREVAPPLPSGTPTDICLATGESITVQVTAQGDTLVGPNRVSIESLRPGVVFAGVYAAGRDWFESDRDVSFDNRSYQKSGDEVRLDCANLMRAGEYMGVPVFANRNADRPFEMVYLPVRPGVWQAYETGLRRTRGD